MNFFGRHTLTVLIFCLLLSACLLILSPVSCLADDLVFSFGNSENASITLTSERDLEFTSFKVNNPYRLVIDVKNCSVTPAELIDKQKQIPKIRINKIGTTSRIVLEPLPGIQLMTRQDSPHTITVFGSEAAQVMNTMPLTSSGSQHEIKGSLSGNPVSVNTLVIKENSVNLGTSGLVGSISTFNFPDSNKFIFVFADTKLAIKQGLYKLNFLNLTGMDVQQQGANTKITFHVKPKTTFPNYFSVKDENEVNLRFFVTDPTIATTVHQGQQSVEASRMSHRVSRFTGQKISLDFDNADIRHVIRLMSDVNKKNYLINDEVKGTLSLKLSNVPWDQALELILKNNNLAAVTEGNVTEIITFNQSVERLKKKLELEDFNKSQEQISICSVQLRHAAATRVASAAGTILTKGAKEFSSESAAKVQAQGQGTEDKQLASDGSKTVDNATITKNRDAKSTSFSINNIYAEPNTNRLIIRDYPSKFIEILKVLSLLDVPDQQVMIEARIVEASSDFTKSLGVQWGTHYRDGTASFAGINTLDTGFGGIANAPAETGASGPGINTGISFGTLASNINLSMRFSAAATSGLIKIVSTPKVAVTYGEKATIKDGKKQPYSTTSSNGTQTQFVDAALSLEVTPIITPSCDVVMDINVTNDSVGAGSPPPINQKSAKTKLTVKSGETAVIGGTYVNEETDSSEGVPFLMDIPFLGNFFKSSATAKRQRELLIFITPRLIDSACNGSEVMQLKHEKLECAVE